MKRSRNKWTPDKIRKRYANIGQPASLSDANKLAKASRQSLTDVQRALAADKKILTHQKVVTKFRRRRVVAQAFEINCVDLKDFTSLAEHNSNFKWLLFSIDVGSRFLYCQPMKTKSASDCADALDKIFKNMKKDGRDLCRSLMADRGSEFSNKKVSSLLKKNNIHFFTSSDGRIKASIVERVIRTISSMIYKYFTLNNTLSYLPVLQKIVDTYNNTTHSAINMAPADVTHDNKHDLWLKQLLDEGPPRRPKFKVGQHVFITKDRRTFEKGYSSKLIMEIFKIKKVVLSNPVTYILEDLDENQIEGTFYAQEMKLTQLPETFEIETILKTRTKTVNKRKIKEHFVKWKYYPSSMNSWIEDSWIV